MEEISALMEKGLSARALSVGLGPAYTEAATNQEILGVFRVGGEVSRVLPRAHSRVRTADRREFSGFEEVMADAAITGAPLHIVHNKAPADRT